MLKKSGGKSSEPERACRQGFPLHGLSEPLGLQEGPEIRQSKIKYPWSLGRWYKWIVDQASDVPSIIIFHDFLQKSHKLVNVVPNCKGSGDCSSGFGIQEPFNGDSISSLIKSFYFTLYLLICQLHRSGSALNCG